MSSSSNKALLYKIIRLGISYLNDSSDNINQLNPLTKFKLIFMFFPYLAVKDEVRIPYQNQPLNSNPVKPPQTAPSSGVESSTRVPLVNNRKGSLWLPSTSSSLLRLTRSGSRDLGQTLSGRTTAGLGMDDPRLQRACSLPVKYRYHPSHASTSMLNQRQCKSRPAIA